MKYLITTIAALVLVGCGASQPTAKAPVLTIYEAARRGDIAAVIMRLAAGTKADTKTKDGTTPLHTAARFGHKEVAELHIAKGADVNAAVDGITPLHFAVANDAKELAELLIAAGADVNAKTDMFEETPLHDAVVLGNKEIVELLIAKGAVMNAKDDNGSTPLDRAIEELQNTPLDRAIEERKTETANFLRKHGGKSSKELKAAGN